MRSLATWFGLGWLLIGTPVFADGLFFRPNFSYSGPVSVGQIGADRRLAPARALLVCMDRQVQVTLRTYFRAGPRELAWVIPVPHCADKGRKGRRRRFSRSR